jgi:hypothetical protein
MFSEAAAVKERNENSSTASWGRGYPRRHRGYVDDGPAHLAKRRANAVCGNHPVGIDRLLGSTAYTVSPARSRRLLDEPDHPTISGRTSRCPLSENGDRRVGGHQPSVVEALPLAHQRSSRASLSTETIAGMVDAARSCGSKPRTASGVPPSLSTRSEGRSCLLRATSPVEARSVFTGSLSQRRIGGIQHISKA